jgi:hypothetical protein
MKIFSIQCPNCGANIKVNDNTIKTKCEFCNSDINISKLVPNYHPEIKKVYVVKNVIEKKPNTPFVAIIIFFIFFVVLSFGIFYQEDTPIVYVAQPTPTIKVKPDHIIDFGRWEGNNYINEALGWKVNVPEGWSISKDSLGFLLSEFTTGNRIYVTIHKYKTAEGERRYDASQGKPGGKSYRKNEETGTEELAGDTYLTYYYDAVSDLESEKYYYRDIVWEDNDWELGDDSIEIRCTIQDKSSFDINKIIKKLKD